MTNTTTTEGGIRKDKNGTIMGTTRKAPFGYGACPVCKHKNVHRGANGRLIRHGSIELGGMCPFIPCQHPMHDNDCPDGCEDPRAPCEHCGKPIATYEDGEMQVGDPRIALLCWSDEGTGTLCKSLPPPRDYAEEERAYGDYLRQRAKDEGY